jgi:hypothetical protein
VIKQSPEAPKPMTLQRLRILQFRSFSASCYIRGIGVDQNLNLAEAYQWFARAANQGD